MDTIIGRKKELEILEEALVSVSAEFIAIYGRRRVGKTFLIKEFFSKQSGMLFELTGNNGSLKSQLANFSIALSKTFYNNAEMAVQANWMDAFRQLDKAIESTAKNKRITIFFDELPWLSTPKSGFLKALEYFWNTKWVNRKKLILVVCGSAASWMIKKIVHAKGGLHNRITVNIALQPFSLEEVDSYLKYKKCVFNQQQTLQLYMVLGGIPHYLNKIRNGLSVAQNINHLCFQKGGFLLDEFDKLFHSLYEEPDIYVQLIRVIGKKRGGISRETLIKNVKKISDGGTLNVRLQSLEEAGFISTFLPLGHARRGLHYRLIDEYTIFFLYWIEPFRKKTRLTEKSSYWMSMMKSPSWHAWSGYAFEAVCLKHIEKIKYALKIDAIHADCGDWRYISEKGGGAQIDLLFDRDDDCITLCEIKHTDNEFIMTKDYAGELEKKRRIYKEQTRTKKQITWCLITVNGASKNAYFKDLITHLMTLGDFFK